MNLASVVARWTGAPSSLSNGRLRMRAIYSVTSRSPSPEGPARLTLTSMFKNTTLSSSSTWRPRSVLLQTFSSTRRRPWSSSTSHSDDQLSALRTHTWHSEFLSRKRDTATFQRDVTATFLSVTDTYVRTYIRTHIMRIDPSFKASR